jgi:hypothetical protein
MSNPKDYIQTIADAERRFVFAPVTIDARADDNTDGPAIIEGYALKFNSQTTIGNHFREEIMPGSLDDVLNDDVRALFNHDPNFVLARSNNGAGTLKLELDATGLKYRFETPNVSYAKDLAENIRLGNVSQSSFAFGIDTQEWEERDGDLPLRKITKFKRLYDVSPVTYPAYQDTSVAQRSLNAFQTENAKPIEINADQSANNNEPKQLTVRNAQLNLYKY